MPHLNSKKAKQKADAGWGHLLLKDRRSIDEYKHLSVSWEELRIYGHISILWGCHDLYQLKIGERSIYQNW